MTTVATTTGPAGWLESRRPLITGFLGALSILAVQFGLGQTGQWEQILIIAGAVLGFISAGLSLLNVKVADWATQGWAIVRGAIYALATIVSPALVILGVYNEDVNTQVVAGIGQTLTVLSSAIAIFANGQQQKVAAVEMAEGTDGTWRLTPAEQQQITESRRNRDQFGPAGTFE